jgi:hypothetical protein
VVIQAGQFSTASDCGRTQFSASVDDCVDWEVCEGEPEVVGGADLEDLEGPLKESI